MVLIACKVAQPLLSGLPVQLQQAQAWLIVSFILTVCLSHFFESVSVRFSRTLYWLHTFDTAQNLVSGFLHSL